MAFVVIPHSNMFFCPICKIVDGKDSTIDHLRKQHDWNEPDIIAWLLALDS